MKSRNLSKKTFLYPRVWISLKKSPFSLSSSCFSRWLKELIVSLSLFVRHSQLTHYPLPPLLLLFLRCHNCRTTGTGWRQTQLFFSFLPFALFLIPPRAYALTQSRYSPIMSHFSSPGDSGWASTVLWVQAYL